MDAFSEMLEQFAPDLPEVSLSFSSGWSSELTFLEALEQGRGADQKIGFTRMGPHRADLVCTVAGRSVFQVMSQGQQKVMAYALSIAQGEGLVDQLEQACVYLIDDLPAELDILRRERIISGLVSTGAQVLITAIESEQVLLNANKGKVQTVIQLD